MTEPFDPSGGWLAHELAKHASEEVLHLTSRDIATAAQADRGVDDGGVWFRVVAASGRVVESRKLRGVVNRICSSPGALTHGMGGRTTEAPSLGAPLMRWLHRWPGPVLNRPNVDGLSGDFRPSFWWLDHAVRAGFAVPRSQPDFGDRSAPSGDPASAWVAVAGDDVHALDDPGRVIAMSLCSRCRRLAHAAGAAILGIEAASTHTGEWTFGGASLRPDLSRGGEPLVRSVMRALAMGHMAGGNLRARQVP
ncbi:MAG: hypothetical protein ACREIA_10935 [Opitutaceae bacterium]